MTLKVNCRAEVQYLLYEGDITKEELKDVIKDSAINFPKKVIHDFRNASLKKLDNQCRIELASYISEENFSERKYFKSALVVSSKCDYGILRAIKSYSYPESNNSVYICYSMDYAIDHLIGLLKDS
jgi:hypothetical protein